MRMRKILESKKASVKITLFIIAALTACLVSVVFMTFVTGVTNEYGVDYNQSDMEAFNKFGDLNSTITEIHDTTKQAKETTGVLDKIGALFSSGYNTMLLTTESIDVVSTMIDAGIDKMNLGITATSFKIYVGMVILVLIIIGVVISTLTKREQ